MTEKRLDNQTREEIAQINNCHIGSIIYYNAITKFYKDILYVEMTETSKLKIVCIPDYDADEVNEFIENELMIGVEYEIIVEDNAMKTMTGKRFELIELYGDAHLIDNETNEKIGYDLHSPSTFNANWNNVCNLLNKFHEENKELKKENHQLKQLIQAIISKEFEISSEDNDYDALTEFFKNEVSISQIEVDIDVEKEEREY